MVTAFVMIKTEGRRASEVAQRIAAIEHVAEVYSVTGDYDLIAILRLPDYERLAEVVPDQIAITDGITDTQTVLAFRAFTRRELDSAYDIGLS
ncbi:Lrp/AsnC family transcriptional regulator [Kallotenue papyrolyticum]|uniref:Lrp/AsnC family transcriptional regulator n=1 Tax=Kallotenue papyrolyticum TaxID=1325125 RepID=UPI0004785AB8|nr:Lrp/AsnC ligand binding domain-containing protein [Kallotenue papyrolyticum]